MPKNIQISSSSRIAVIRLPPTEFGNKKSLENIVKSHQTAGFELFALPSGAPRGRQLNWRLQEGPLRRAFAVALREMWDFMKIAAAETARFAANPGVYMLVGSKGLTKGQPIIDCSNPSDQSDFVTLDPLMKHEGPRQLTKQAETMANQGH